MDCICTAPLACINLCLSFTHSHTHSHIHTPTAIACHARYQLACQEQLGVLFRDTSTRPGWDWTGNPPTARGLLLPPVPHRPNLPGDKHWITSKGNTVIVVVVDRFSKCCRFMLCTALQVADVLFNHMFCHYPFWKTSSQTVDPSSRPVCRAFFQKLGVTVSLTTG